VNGWWDVFMRVAVILNAVVALICIGIRRYDLAALNVSVVALWVALQAHERGAADA